METYEARNSNSVGTLGSLLLPLIASAICTLSCSPDIEVDEQAVQKPQMIILYLIDTLRADHLGAYGYNRNTSPAIDRLAQDGLLFEYAYAQSSWTRPSVASLFTGLLPSRHGAVRRSHKLRSDVATLAEILLDSGYSTAAFVSNPNVIPVFGFGRGFENFFDVETTQKTGTADKVHAAVDEYLDLNSRHSQFLYIHTRDPHDPYSPPPPYDRRFQPQDAELVCIVARYDGEIAFNDSEFSKLIDRLKAEQRYDESLIIVTSDHGEEFLDHGNYWHGKTLYNEQLRVPLVIKLPHSYRRGTRVQHPVRLVDLLPTLTELVGSDPPPELDGTSFLHLFETDELGDYRPLLYAELDLGPNVIESLIHGDRKIIRYRSAENGGSTQLFDLRSDPLERWDLAESEPTSVIRMTEKLERVRLSMESGYYLEFTNSRQLADHHLVEGELEAIDGTFESWSFQNKELSDFVALDDSGARMRFSLDLSNYSNPIDQRPPVIVDIDRIQFDLHESATAVLLSLQLDGEDAPAEWILLGKETLTAFEGTAITISVGDPKLQIRSRDDLRNSAPPYPSCRIYFIGEVAPEEAIIGKELDQRLRALGYLGD